MKRIFKSRRTRAKRNENDTSGVESDMPPAKPATTLPPTATAPLPLATTQATSPVSKSLMSIKLPPPLKSDAPIYGKYGGGDFCIGGGVAIFHVATGRVVVCQHSEKGYYFLPKGRRDVLEESGRGAEREGYEESGYRNRLLPLPLKHRQPLPHRPTAAHVASYCMEPVWTSITPMNPTLQYIMHWYIAETLPPSLEAELDAAEQKAKTDSNSAESTAGRKHGEAEEERQATYLYPPPFPLELSLRERLAMEEEGYEPPRHAGATIQGNELKFVSSLVPIEEAVRLLGESSTYVEVVRRGWEGIVRRLKMEGVDVGVGVGGKGAL